MTTSNYDWNRITPDVIGKFREAHMLLAKSGLDRKLHHLVLLRASQINRCAFCVDMHYREALADGDTPERLNRVVVFDQFDDFSPAEKAALAWTEALTELHLRPDVAALRSALEAHFSEEEIGQLTMAVAMINLWNRIQVARH